MTEREEWIWLAGLLEGEGCFARYKHDAPRRHQISVDLQMGDRDVVARAAKLFQRPIQVVPALRNPAWSTMYRTRAYGYDAERIMRRVRPYMGKRRGARIDELLALKGLSHHPRTEAT